MFEQSIKVGENGEHVIWNLLQKMPKVRSIVDVRQDKVYQSQDIDFLIENYDRQFTPIEVKTDYKAHETGNVVYELTTSGNIGCFAKTRARFIYYYVPADNVVYAISVRALRNYIEKVKPEERRMGDNATGYLLPIENLIKAKVIVKVHKGVT